jgi:Flp pilus assembly protein TadD
VKEEAITLPIYCFREGKISVRKTTAFDQAISIYPADAQAHNNRGLVKVKLGNLAGARADVEKALQLDPSLAEADSNLRRLNSAQ